MSEVSIACMPVDSAEQGITHIITHYRGSTRSASAHRREGDRFESRIVRVGGMPWPKQAQLITMHS